MKDVLAPTGYMPTETLEDADMVILNTVIFVKKFEKVFSDLGRLRKLKDRAAKLQNKQMLIAVALCGSGGARNTRRDPWVDMVVGPQTYHRLPELVAKADPISRHSVVDIEFPTRSSLIFCLRKLRPEGQQPRSFEGCDKFCSFCVVLHAR